MVLRLAGVFLVGIPYVTSGPWKVGLYVFCGLAIVSALVVTVALIIKPTLLEPLEPEEFRRQQKFNYRQIALLKIVVKQEWPSGEDLQAAVEGLLNVKEKP